MKDFTKIIVAAFSVAALFFSTNASAQGATSADGYRFDIGVEGGAPTYAARQYLSNVYGGATARFQFGLSDNLAATVTSGFYNMFSKTTTVNGVSTQLPGVGIVPIKVGLKAYAGGGVYFAVEGGQGYETSRDATTNAKDQKSILAGGLGYQGKNLDVSVRYESFYGQNFNYGLIGLRLAYGFNFGTEHK